MKCCDETHSNLLEMGVVLLPVRGLAHGSGGMITWGQLDGVIAMFYGHFFKGVKTYIPREESVHNIINIKEKRDEG